MQLAPVDPADLLRQATQVVQMTATQAKVTLQSDVARMTVSADGDRVVQVLVNLLGNAIKFAPRGSTFHFTLPLLSDGEASLLLHGKGEDRLT